LGFDAGDSNLYRYVNNGPTNAMDESGLQVALPNAEIDGAIEGKAKWLNKNFELDNNGLLDCAYPLKDKVLFGHAMGLKYTVKDAKDVFIIQFLSLSVELNDKTLKETYKFEDAQLNYLKDGIRSGTKNEFLNVDTNSESGIYTDPMPDKTR